MTTIGKDQAIRVRGTVGHRTRAHLARVVHSGTAPIVDPATTFVMLAALLTVDELIVAGDGLVGWLNWCTVDELEAAVGRHRAQGTSARRALPSPRYDRARRAPARHASGSPCSGAVSPSRS